MTFKYTEVKQEKAMNKKERDKFLQEQLSKMSSEYPIHGPSDKCPACGSDDIWGSGNLTYCSNSNCRYVYEIRMDFKEDE